MSAVSIVFLKVFVLRRISLDAPIAAKELVRRVADDIALLPTETVQHVLFAGSGGRDTQDMCEALGASGVITIELKSGEYYYQRTAQAEEWERAVARNFPGLHKYLERFPMSSRGLLETLARG